MSDRIKKIKEGHNINVYLDGELYDSFHEIADDYAHTNAKKCVEQLRRNLPPLKK
jgi:hypothetical protein